LIYRGKISTDFLDQKKENLNNNKRLHLKQDQMLVKVQTPIKEQHLALDKVLTLIKEQHLALDKVLTLIKDQHLAHQIVIKLLHKLLIFLKYLQMGERKNINSQGQKKVDQANNLLQPKDQDKEQGQLKLLTAIMEVVNHQDSRQTDKIILSLIVLMKALKNHHQPLHLLATDQIKNHQLLDQEGMYINLEGDLKKAMGENKQVHLKTMETETKKVQE
jgi:hypothetical protein